MTKTTRKTEIKENQNLKNRTGTAQPAAVPVSTTNGNGAFSTRRKRGKGQDRRLGGAEHEDGFAEFGDLGDASRTGSAVDNTDDPVRMYLMQMGQIPLLERMEEIDAAREIEMTR